jgi:hypothetical protein
MNSVIFINIVFEDSPGEFALRKILEVSNHNLLISHAYNAKGFGNIKKNIKAYNNASRIIPYLVLTDLDNYSCPIELKEAWAVKNTNSNFIFRIAVKEVESWLLADKRSFAEYFCINENKIPENTDSINDPKLFLINLIRNSKRKEFKEDMIPAKNSTAIQGRNYNRQVILYIKNIWNPKEAMKRSPSLKRAVNCISLFNS